MRTAPSELGLGVHIAFKETKESILSAVNAV